MKIADLDDLELLRGTLRLEAEGEPFIGKLAVVCVIKNRVEDKRWPDNVREVILQPKQFSCFNDIDLDAELSGKLILTFTECFRTKMWWRECHIAAFGGLYDWYSDITSGANHYHTVDVHPYWSKDRQPCFEVGRHKFFKL